MVYTDTLLEHLVVLLDLEGVSQRDLAQFFDNFCGSTSLNVFLRCVALDIDVSIHVGLVKVCGYVHEGCDLRHLREEV